MKRKIAGCSVTTLAVLFLVIALRYGWVSSTDISAALTVTVVSVAIAALCWSWKTDIDRWFAVRKQTGEKGATQPTAISATGGSRVTAKNSVIVGRIDANHSQIELDKTLVRPKNDEKK